MWELDCEESWALKNWCFWTVVLEKTLESPLDCKEIQPVHPKGDQSWCSLVGLMLRLKLPYFGHLMQSWLIGKDPDAGRDWGQEEKGTTEDEMAGWHHRLDAHEFGWTPGVGDGQGGLECCDSWGCKESDTTERLNWTELMQTKKQNLNLYLKLYLKINSKCILDICVRCENRILQVSVLPCFLAGEMIWNSGVCLLLTEAIRQFCGFRSLLIHTLRYP